MTGSGKRPRLMMRRTVSVASLGTGAALAGSDHPSSADQLQQHPVVPHQVIGFAPKAFSENSNFVFHDAGEPSPGSSSSSASPGSRSNRPFSGLSSLTNTGSSSNSNASKEPNSPCAEKVGLGIVAALDTDGMFGSACSPTEGIAIIRSSMPQAAAVPAGNVNHHHQNNFFNNPDYYHNNRKQKAAVVLEAEAANFHFCFQANSAKYDRCSLRPSFTTLGFLESCYLCKRDISHGRDIYMYRGDRAFCSAECRHQQILNDERLERREKCSSAALKQVGSVPQQSRHVHQRTKVNTPATTAAAA